jgi:hypothetical protein
MQIVDNLHERELKRAMLARPFVPFTLVMRDGRRFEITDRGRIAYVDDLIFVRQAHGWEYPRLRMHDLAAVELTRRPESTGGGEQGG